MIGNYGYSLPCQHLCQGPQSFIFSLALFCPAIKASQWSSSLSALIGDLFITSMMPHTGKLNDSITGLCGPGLCGIGIICNKARFISTLEPKHFLIVHLMNLIHTSTYSLLWWWYDDDTACFIFRSLQNSLSFSEMKLLPASDIIFWVICIL